MVTRATKQNELTPRERCATLALSLTPGVGTVTLNNARAAARAANVPLSALLHMDPRAQAHTLPPGFEGIAPLIARCGDAHLAWAAHLLAQVAASGGEALSIQEAHYPAELREHLGARAPALLFVRGDPALLTQPAAAIVGARRATRSGRRLARACATTLAGAGAAVVSGGAQGVDTAAHEAVLASAGKTVVVLPQGLLSYRIPPAIRRGVEEGNALLVSEFSPDTVWSAHAAVTRNATISALARLVCVIEPKRVGGSIRTARIALEQGKRVLMHTPSASGVAAALPRSTGPIPLGETADTCDADALLRAWRAGGMKRPAQAGLC
ncbi:MAG: hypothetical protein GWP08_11845 [Nitrospiraceae bacterium]|nr:hypothetical protein [Nitrospiraceae bacterium]